MGKVAFHASKTSCFTSMTLYDTLRKRVIYPKPFGINELASQYDTLPKNRQTFLGRKIRTQQRLYFVKVITEN